MNGTKIFHIPLTATVF